MTKGHCKIGVLGLLILLVPLSLYPAETPEDSLGWHNKWNSDLTLTQTSFDNWTEKGGTNQFNVNWYNDMRLLQITDHARWRTTTFYTLEYGRIGSQSLRKSDDRLETESVYSFDVPWKIDPYIALGVVTQLFPGYAYPEEGSPVLTSGIFDPGYVNQSMGFTHYLNDILVSRMGFSVKETFARDLARHVLPDTTKSYGVEYGLELVTDYDQEFGDWLEITSRLDVFSQLRSLNTTDVRWKNYIAFRFRKFLTLQIQWTLIYDSNQSLKRQLRDILTFGFHYSVF